jgi:hypothetical protein
VPLLNLSYVTKSLANLIEEAVKASPEWSSTASLTVSPQPPDELMANVQGNTLGFYLYHINEDPHFKNLPSSGSDTPPIRYTPMGLILHYQLTAHADKDDNGVLQEQLMMGLAIKSLHDYPTIDSSTQIVDKSGTSKKIFDPHLSDDNRLRISMIPLPINEAVSYWSAGSAPLRLAAYYEVSVVLLEPEEIRSRASRVLTYDVYSFIQGAPRLSSSSTILSFTVPGETVPREIVLQPAEVSYDQVVTFKGMNLTAKETALLLNNSKWDTALEVDSNWGVAAKPEEVSAKIKQIITRPPLPPVTILPGIYSAQVKVIDERITSDGHIRRFEKLSNITPFTITPKIDLLGIPNGLGVFDVTASILQHTHLSPWNVLVFIGETRLTPGNWGSLNQGEFADLENIFHIILARMADLDLGIMSPNLNNDFVTAGVILSANAIIVVEKSGEKWRIDDGDDVYLVRKESGVLNVYTVTRLQVRLPGGLTTGSWVPFRLVINGAESQPQWVKAP